MKKALVATAVTLVTVAFAGTADVKLKGVNTNEDTAIIIKKGAQVGDCVQYEIIDGHEEIAGDSNFAKETALNSWKTACKEWKASMREMNKDNQMIALNCNTPIADKANDQVAYKSTGSYKVKVKMQEKKQ
jgi:hypothetical protein